MENENFSDEDQCQHMYTLEFFAYIFFGIRETSTRKIPSRKMSTNQTHLWKISTQKTPTWNIPTHVFKYIHPSFLIFFFFHYCHHYHWYYLDCFVILCFKSAEVFKFESISQNEGLSEERQLMKSVGIFQMIIFWVAIFRRGFSRGEFDGWEFLGWVFSRGDFHRTIFFI